MNGHFREGAVTAAILFALAAAIALRQSPSAGTQRSEPATTGTAGRASIDAVARLQEKLDKGETTLHFDSRFGYLPSLLQHLEVPVSSQTLVFSKSSAQMSGISPEMPRAVYFSDEVYVGWVQEGAIELAAIDPGDGPAFYTLPQIEEPRPRFERHTETCVGCHDSSEDLSRIIPRLLMLSVLPDRNGSAIDGAALATTDRSPFRERWGGWYVTGTHGKQQHMGNMTFSRPATEIRSIPGHIGGVDLTPGANLTDLSRFFDTQRYPSPHSDIVALMVLGHQTQVQNLMAVALHRLKDAGESAAGPVRELAEPIVNAMLFSGEAALTGPVAGTSQFAADFAKIGPRDQRGRSLRDLDLNRRLLRYPLSYLIYTESFDRLPTAVKTYVYRRLREILNGDDKAPAYAHLSSSDRQAILEIVRDTKPDFNSSTSAPVR